MTEIPLKPKNDQNTSKTQKMTKILPKQNKKKETKIPLNPKNDQNTLKTQKITLKPKKRPKYPLCGPILPCVPTV